ncbi:MAG: amidohydrolase family protein [Gammaproteobacteria bacterium]
MADLAIVDAHQHFWDLQRNDYPWLRIEPPIPFRYGDYRAIRRNYLPPDYTADSAGFRVANTVHVEAEWNPADPVGETRWLHDLHARYGLPTVIVAQAWLDRDDAAEVLGKQAAFPLVRGIRHKPRAAPSAARVQRGAPGSMGDPKWRAGFALLERLGLSFDLQTPYWHLAEARELAEAFPGITIILNHTGLPVDRSPEHLSAWYVAMKTLAQAPNVAVKISGLGIRGQPWRTADNRRVVQDTIALFGVERCMFASNFPVDGLVGNFATIYAGFQDIVHDLSSADQARLFHDNARRYYRIG